MGAYELIEEKIKSKDNSKKILSRINALFKSFSYLNISEEELYNIVLEEIDKANNAVEKADSYDKYLLSMINNRLINISRELLSDLDSSFKIIDNYINKNIKNVKNISDSILYFDKINEIFDSCGLIPSLELIQYLISNNNTFSRMISLIVKHYKNKIVNEEIEEVFDNDTILTSIDVYCDVVDKSIKQEEMVKETRKVSSKSSLNEYPATRRMNERPVLKQSEELDVVKKIAEGDEKARELLIESNLRLVSKYAFKYSYSKIPVEDLFQEGIIGLMTAVDKFDYTRGVKFSTVATFWIRQAIKRFIDDNARTIRLPVYLSEKIYKFNKNYNKLELELGRPPTIDELSKKTRLSRKKVEELITVQNDALSLDTPVGEDGEDDLYSFVSGNSDNPHDTVIDGTLKEQLVKLIDNSKLDSLNKNIVKYYFGLMDGVPHSFEETGKKFNKSKQMIDQIVKKSIRRIRNSSAVFEMANYFEDEERAKNNIIALRAGKSISNKKSLPNLSIYQLIKGNKAKIDETIENLSEEARAVIEKRYGSDLENPDFYELSPEEIVVFNDVIKTIKSSCYNSKKVSTASKKTIYQKISNYSKEQVDITLGTFLDKELDVLKKRYGKDFDHPEYRQLLPDEFSEFTSLFVRIKKRLQYLYGTDKSSLGLNLYQQFSNNTREDVCNVVLSFSEDKVQLLKKMYGDNLEEVHFKDLTSEEGKIIFDEIYPVLTRKLTIIYKNRLKGINSITSSKSKTIYEIIGDDFTEEEVDALIEKLKEAGEDLSLVYKRYGGDLKNPIFTSLSSKEYAISYNKILKIKKILNGEMSISVKENKKDIKKNTKSNKIKNNIKSNKSKNNTKSNKIKNNTNSNIIKKNSESKKSKNSARGNSLYDLVGKNGETKEQIDEAIEKLKGFREDVSILYVRYGPNLDKPVKVLTEDENRTFQNIISKLRRIIANPNMNIKKHIFFENNTLFEAMEHSEYSKEQVLSGINKLNDDEINVLKRIFGNDFENICTTAHFTEEEKKVLSKLKNEIKKSKRGVLNKPHFNGETIYESMKKLGYNKIQVDGAIKKLVDGGVDVSILYKRFGPTLNEIVSQLDENETIALQKLKQRIQRHIANPNIPIVNKKLVKNKNLYQIMEEYGYTKDKVDKVISKLSEKSITVLKEIYGEDFNSPCTIKIGKKEYKVLSKLRKVIENPETPNGELPKKRVGRKRDTFYELMVNQRYSKDQVDGVVATLSMEEINKLKGFYGDNFDEIYSDDLTKEENVARVIIINKIRKRLENPEVRKGRRRKKKDNSGVSTREKITSFGDNNSLMQLSKDFSKEQMIDAINSLPDKYKDVFKKRFGNDFSNVKGLNPEDYDVYLEALEGLKNVLSKPKRLTIYQLLKEYPKERVNQVIDSLSDEEKELLYRKYGKKLKKPVFKELSQEDSDEFYGTLLPKMRKALEKKSKSLTKKTIYQLAGKYEKNLVNYVISSLNDDEKKILVLRYGYNLIEPIYRELNDDSKDEFTKVLAKVRRQLVIASKEKNLYQIMDGYSKEEVNKVIPSVLSNDDINMLKKKFGKNYDNPYSQILTEIEKKHLTGVILKRIKTELDNPGSLSQKKLVKTKKTVSSSLKSPRNRETLFNSIVKLHDSFSYINISQEEFDDIVLSSIEDSTKEYNGTVEYNKFLLGIIKDRLNDKVNALVNNTESSYDVINNYIKNTCGNIKTAKKALQEFNRISSFFDLYDYSPDEEVISKLIDDNDVFSKMISLIVRGYRQEILSGNTESLTDNPSLLSRVCEYVGTDNVDYTENKPTRNLSNSSLLDRAIKEYPVLNADDEYKITKRIAEGDSEARDTFILSNIRLVKSIAATIHTNFFSFDDLVQEGFLGLMAAINKFDYTRGYKFSTYASWWIRQSITRAVADKDTTVRLPVHKIDELNRFNRVRSNLIQVLGREPTDVDIANEMKIPLEKVWEMIELPSPTVSLDAPVSTDEDSETTLSNFVSDNNKSPSETFMDNSFSEEFDKFIHSIDLKDREIDITRSYFDFDRKGPKTLEMIGKEYNLTRERIRQILIKVEKRIVKSPKFEALLEYSEFADVYKEKLVQLREHLYKTNSLVMDKPNKPKKNEKVKKKSNRRKKI